jgi:serine/threonine protein kinase
LRRKPSLDIPNGTLIAGRYRVVEKLGEGGMGVVLAAIHEPLGTRVAVKILGPALASDSAFAARFLREAKAAAGLRSEFVVAVTDFGEDAVGPFMAMEYLDGEDLGHRLERAGILGREQAVDAILQAAAGLEAAHRAGIIHRDLKPSNLFRTVRADGSHLTRVLDFGIARQVTMEASTDITATGQVLGTPMYMSPEQIRTPRGIDARSDVWSLGAVLFELLVGEPPFVEESMGPLMAAILEKPAPDVRLRRQDVAPELAAVVARCLAKDRAERPASMSELASLLAPFGSDEGRIAARRAHARAHADDGVVTHASLPPGRPLATSSTTTVALTPPPTNVTPPPIEGVERKTEASRTHGGLAWLAVAALGTAVVAAAIVVWSDGDGATAERPVASTGTKAGPERVPVEPTPPVDDPSDVPAPPSAASSSVTSAPHVVPVTRAPLPSVPTSSAATPAAPPLPTPAATPAAAPASEPSLF